MFMYALVHFCEQAINLFKISVEFITMNNGLWFKHQENVLLLVYAM